ncbi:MAG: hypothetical protein R3C44_04385 [Chloroflexota bacterium]
MWRKTVRRDSPALLPINPAGHDNHPVIGQATSSADCAPDDHRIAYACAAYVLETADSKTVLLWDIDNQNDWLIDPQTADQETAGFAQQRRSFVC